MPNPCQTAKTRKNGSGIHKCAKTENLCWEIKCSLGCRNMKNAVIRWVISDKELIEQSSASLWYRVKKVMRLTYVSSSASPFLCIQAVKRVLGILHFLRCIGPFDLRYSERINPCAQIIRTIPTIQQLSSHNLGSGRYTVPQILCRMSKTASSGSSKQDDGFSGEIISL